MILSLFWRGMTSLGAKCAMVAGFMGVPLFSFVIPQAIEGAGYARIASYIRSLDVLLPSFAIGFGVAIVVSLLDTRGRDTLGGVEDDLEMAGAPSPDLSPDLSRDPRRDPSPNQD